MDITLGATTRRRILSTGLFALAAAFVPAAMLVQNAEAGKKKKKISSVRDRTQDQRKQCETIGGGQLAVLDGPNGGNTTECKGGAEDGHTCYNTKNSTTCTQGRTQSPGNEHPLEPDPPFADIGDVPTHPLQPDEPPYANPDGPIYPMEPDGSGGMLKTFDGGTHDQTRPHGKRRRNGRGKSRKR